MKTKTALITGITGQDGSYLAEYLLEKGYNVVGIIRRTSLIKTERIDHLFLPQQKNNGRFSLVYGDMLDAENIIRIISEIQPDEIYNLAAQSHVKVSFDTPLYTCDADALGALRILEAIRILKLEDKTNFYQASTSEMFGNEGRGVQDENTPMLPRSPYGAAKLFAYSIARNYRDAYNIFACNGILFNHESPRRGETFVTRKATIAIAKILFGLQDVLYIGNLNAVRDFGHAKDYVKAMHMIMQHIVPDDFVIATGHSYSVRDFITMVFEKVGIKIAWFDSGPEETARITEFLPNAYAYKNPITHLKTGNIVVKVDPFYFRPTDVNNLCGNASKARNQLGWQPEHTLDDLITEMVANDIRMVQKELLIANSGFKNESYFK